MISAQGKRFLQNEEGCLLYVYDDKAKGRPKPPYKRGQIVHGTLTIFTGHALKKGDPWKIGEVYTQADADRVLGDDLAWVHAIINTHVKVPLNQNQEDALISLIFNCGPGRGKRGQADYVPGIANSRLMEALNRGDYKQAAVHFLDWRYSGGQPILLPRRTRERAIFEKPIAVVEPPKSNVKEIAKTRAKK